MCKLYVAFWISCPTTRFLNTNKWILDFTIKSFPKNVCGVQHGRCVNQDIWQKNVGTQCFTRGVGLTTHSHLAQRLKKEYSYMCIYTAPGPSRPGLGRTLRTKVHHRVHNSPPYLLTQFAHQNSNMSSLYMRFYYARAMPFNSRQRRERLSDSM